MSQLEDRDYVERRLAVAITVAITTTASRAMTAYAKRAPVEREAALREIVAALTTTISNQFEVGQLDSTSRLYITNYVEPRDPFHRQPVKAR